MSFQSLTEDWINDSTDVTSSGRLFYVCWPTTRTVGNGSELDWILQIISVLLMELSGYFFPCKYFHLLLMTRVLEQFITFHYVELLSDIWLLAQGGDQWYCYMIQA